MKRILLLTIFALCSIMLVQSQHYTWAESFGFGGNFSEGRGGLAKTSDGNIVLAYTRDNANWITVLTPNKDTLLHKEYSSFCDIFNVVPVSDGYLICGSFQNQATFNNSNGNITKSHNYINGYIAKLNTSGDVVNAIMLPKGEDGYDLSVVKDIVEDKDGNIVAVGWFRGKTYFDEAKSVSITGDAYGGFIAKYSTDGILLSSKNHDGEFTDIETQDGETFFIAGNYDGDFAIEKYNSDFSMTGRIKSSDPNNKCWGHCYDIKLVGTNIYFAGTSNGSDFNIGGTSVEVLGCSDIVFGKISQSGMSLSMVKSIKGGDYERAYSIDTDSDENIYIAGDFKSHDDYTKSDFDPGTGVVNLKSASDSWGLTNAFIAKYTSSGAYCWAKNIGTYGNKPDRGYNVIIDNNDDVYFFGHSSSYYLYPDVEENTKNTSVSIRRPDGTSYPLFLIKYGHKSAICEMESFSVTGEEYNKMKGDEVYLKLPYSMNITSVVPNITINEGATIEPAVGTPVDLSSPVEYTVTANNGYTKKKYKIIARRGYDMSKYRADTLYFNKNVGPQDLYSSTPYTFTEGDVSVVISAIEQEGEEDGYGEGGSSYGAFSIKPEDYYTGEGSSRFGMINLYPAQCKIDLSNIPRRVKGVEVMAYDNNANTFMQAFDNNMTSGIISSVNSDEELLWVEAASEKLDSLLLLSYEGHFRRMVIYSEKNPASDILKFSFDGQKGKSKLNFTDRTITADAVYGTDISNLTTQMLLSEGASVSPENHKDFSASTSLTVKSSDNVSSVWTVNIDVLPEASKITGTLSTPMVDKMYKEAFVVKAFKKINGKYEFVKSSTLSDELTYEIDGLYKGEEYIILAQNVGGDWMHVSTYNGGKKLLSDVESFSLEGGNNVIDFDLQLIDYSTTTGMGSVSGYFYGAEYIGVDNMEIAIVDNTTNEYVVGSTLDVESVNYGFSSLNKGEYRIVLNYPGVESPIDDYIVKVPEVQYVVRDLDFNVDESTKKVSNYAKNMFKIFDIPDKFSFVVMLVASAEIEIDIKEDFDASVLSPIFELSESASSSITSGEIADFTDPLECILTTNGESRTWSVSVERVQNNRAGFREFNLAGQTFNKYMSNGYVIHMPANIDRSNLVPDALLWHGATSDISITEARDFTSPVKYKVTAENGNGPREYNIFVNDSYDMSKTDVVTVGFDEVGYQQLQDGESGVFTENNVKFRASTYDGFGAYSRLTTLPVNSHLNISKLMITADLTQYGDRIQGVELDIRSFSGSATDTVFFYSNGVKTFKTPKFKISENISYRLNEGETIDSVSFKTHWAYYDEIRIYMDKPPGGEILSYDVTGQVGDEDIRADKNEVNLSVAYGTDLTTLNPIITVTDGASIHPVDQNPDFSKPVKYIVTLGDIQTEWTVNVYVEKNIETELFSCVTSDQVGDTKISNDTVYISLPFGYSNVSVEFDAQVSDGATYNVSDSNFEDYNYKLQVVAENTIYRKDYYIVLKEAMNNKADVESVIFADEIKECEVDKANKKVKVFLPYKYDVEEASLSVNVSFGATFSVRVVDGVRFIDITSQDGNNTATWEMVYDFAKNHEANVLTFVAPEVVGDVEFDHSNPGVYVNLKYGTNIDNIQPQITVSEGATFEFYKMKPGWVIRVVAENGTDVKLWKMRYTVLPNDESKILSLTTSGQVGETITVDDTLKVNLPYGSDASGLSFDITVSEEATFAVSELTSGDYEYTVVVTAQNTTSFRRYFVDVTVLKNDKAELELLNYPDQLQSSELDMTYKTVKVWLPYGYDIENAVPSVDVSAGATYKIVKENDEYYVVVTAENGEVETKWLINFDIAKNDKTVVESFVVDNIVGESEIDESGSTIYVNIANGTDLSSLTPELILSGGATYNYGVSGSEYYVHVTAENGVDEQNWTVVYVFVKNSAADVKTYAVANQVGDTEFDTDRNAIIVTMPYGTDLSGVTGEYTVSSGATHTVTKVDGEDYLYEISVKSEDENQTVVWKVYFVVLKNNKAELVSFVFKGLIADVNIDKNSKRIDAVVKDVDDLTSISVEVKVSEGATVKLVQQNVSPIAVFEDIDLSEPMDLVITSEDGNVIETWKLNVTIFTDVDNSFAKNVKVYPNPASDYIMIDNSSNKTDVYIYDVNGKLVKTRLNESDSIIQIDVDGMPAGVYCLRLIADGQTKTVRIVIN